MSSERRFTHWLLNIRITYSFHQTLPCVVHLGVFDCALFLVVVKTIDCLFSCQQVNSRQNSKIRPSLFSSNVDFPSNNKEQSHHEAFHLVPSVSHSHARDCCLDFSEEHENDDVFISRGGACTPVDSTHQCR